jgi:hypothetical protein
MITGMAYMYHNLYHLYTIRMDGQRSMFSGGVINASFVIKCYRPRRQPSDFSKRELKILLNAIIEVEGYSRVRTRELYKELYEDEVCFEDPRVWLFFNQLILTFCIFLRFSTTNAVVQQC